MPSLKQIRKRITSVKNTRKITKAMKMVSAAKLRRATEKAESSRPYEAELLRICSTVLKDLEWHSPLSENRESKKVVLVLVSTDRGLCGSLNTNLFKAVSRYVEAHPQVDFEAVCFGKKARIFCNKRGIKIREAHIDLLRNGRYALFESVAQKLRDAFLNKQIDRVELFFMQFRSALIQMPIRSTWLPFELPTDVEALEGASSYLFEPKGAELLDRLVPLLINFKLYRAYLESVASEHGARMTAMDAASNNCRDMISRLTLQMNRARQAAITKELMEIIGGAEAISAA
jgi:F-type H+-transporting ATPase subunit gamma